MKVKRGEGKGGGGEGSVPKLFSEILAPDCNEWQNECQSRLTSNLVSAGNLRHINIIVVQTGKLIFVGSKIAAPLNFADRFGRTPRTCLRPAMPFSLQIYLYK